MKYKHRCRLCEGEWNSNNESPAYCGKCRNKNWRAPIEKDHVKCIRCSYSWFPREKGGRDIQSPVKCPKCNSRNWNKFSREELFEKIVGILRD